MNNTETLATLGTQDKDKHNKQNKTQHTKLDEQHRPHKRLQGELRYSRWVNSS